MFSVLGRHTSLGHLSEFERNIAKMIYYGIKPNEMGLLIADRALLSLGFGELRKILFLLQKPLYFIAVLHIRSSRLGGKKKEESEMTGENNSRQDQVSIHSSLDNAADAASRIGLAQGRY